MSLASSLQILKHNEFRWFIFARFFVTVAIQMQMSTIYLQIYYEYAEKGEEELTLGLIGLTEVIPFIVTSFFSGHVADIISRKKIIVAGCIALFIGSLFLWAYSSQYFPALQLFGAAALFSVVFVFGIIRAFLAAATQPFMSQLVERTQYTQATTLNTTVWHTGAILGPVLAGLIYGYQNANHANWCYVINCALFCGAALSYLRIKSKPARLPGCLNTNIKEVTTAPIAGAVLKKP